MYYIDETSKTLRQISSGERFPITLIPAVFVVNLRPVTENRPGFEVNCWQDCVNSVELTC